MSENHDISVVEPDNSIPFSSNGGERPNPALFWSTEKNRVNEIPLTFEIIQSSLIETPSVPINRSIIRYHSPNFVDQSEPLQIYSILLFHNDLSVNGSKIPGILLLHGLNKNNSHLLNEGMKLADKGYVVLLPDLPGHGNSTGITATSDRFYYQGDFNKTAHYYISILSACRAYEILKTLDFVNQSKIALSGVSYGAIIALALGVIYPSEIQGIFSMNGAGDFLSCEEYHQVWEVFNRSRDRFEAEWITKKLPLIDPLYYLQIAPVYPRTVFYFGYYDEYFSVIGLNNTYNALKGEKYMIIRHLGHQTLINHTDSLFYFMDYCLKGSSAPITIDITGFSTFINQTDNVARISFKCSPFSSVQKIILLYRIEFWVAEWKKIEINVSQYSEQEIITKIIHAGPLSANLTFIIEYYQSGSENLMFTSPIFRLRLNNPAQIFYIIAIIICGLIALIIILSLRYNIFVKSLKDFKITLKLKGEFLMHNIIIIGLETLMVYLALAGPWISINGNVYIRFLHVFNIAPAYSDMFSFLKSDSGVNAYSAVLAMLFFIPLIPGALGILCFILGLFVIYGIPMISELNGVHGVQYVGIYGYLWLIASFLISLTELLFLLKIKAYRTKIIERKLE